MKILLLVIWIVSASIYGLAYSDMDEYANMAAVAALVVGLAIVANV